MMIKTIFAQLCFLVGVLGVFLLSICFQLDSNIVSAFIQVVALLWTTLWAGIWLHRKQGEWNDIRTLNQIRYQWKYDFFKSFSEFTLRIGPAVGKYGKYLHQAQELEQSDSAEEDIVLSRERVLESNLELIKIGNELVGFINHSKILFDSTVFQEIEALNKMIHDVFTSVAIDLEKARTIGANFAMVNNMIANEIEKDIKKIKS